MNDRERAEMIEMLSKHSVEVYKALEDMGVRLSVQTIKQGNAAAYKRLDGFEERLKKQKRAFTLLYGEAVGLVISLAEEQG